MVLTRNRYKASFKKNKIERYSFRLFLFFLCFVLNHVLYAQLQFSRLTQAEGLSNKNINCIIQDRKGFMWFGTNDGLNRYDGYTFAIYRTSPKDSTSIGSNFITCLFEDNSGLLWIGTKGGGLNIYDPNTEKFTRFLHDINNPNSISSNDVLSIYSEKPNKIWLGTDGGGLNLFDLKSKSFIHYISGITPGNISSNEIIAINGNQSADLWLGTWNGGLNTKKSNESVFNTITYSNGLQIKHIWSLTNERNQNLWIGTFGYGLFKLNMKSNTIQSIQLNSEITSPGDKVIWTVFEDSLRNKWIGTNNGLYQIVKESNQVLHFLHSENDQSSILSNKVVSVYQSKSGILWIGTDNGVSYLNPNTKKFLKNMNVKLLENNSIYAMAPAKNHGLWLATEKNGICKLEIQKKGSQIQASLKVFETIKTDGKINTILEDSKNILWIGTRYGVVCCNMNSNSIKRFYFDQNDIQNSSNDVLAICETENADEYWIGTDNGLYLYNQKTGKFRKYIYESNVASTINSNHILTIYKDKRKNIWISTWKGLNIYNSQTDNFTSIQESGVNNMYINSLHDDSRGNLWLGTRSGLYKYDIESGTSTAYTEEEGLSNNNICQIIDDLSGNLWLSTNKGLSKFKLNTGEFKNFDSQDGLLNNTFSTNSGFISDDGTIYLGGTNGLDAFMPNEIKTNIRKVPLVFNDFRILNKPVSIGEPGSPLQKSITNTSSIVLTARDEIFSIGFVALSYVNSNKCKYSYQLENFEKEWTQIGTERKATYTNLNAGNYIFKVKASNEDGVWCDNVISLNIKVLPPWWKTRWFKIILVVAVFLIFFVYYRYRIYQYHQRNKLLEKIITERVKEINQQKEKLAHQAAELSESNLLLNDQKNEIERQALDISRMNELLLIRNENLVENVEELSKARAMNTSVTFEEFQHIYPDDESCRKLIYELKSKSPFVCHVCQKSDFTEINNQYSRRCKHCGYIESVTVGTIFYHLKFPIVKAFYILYLVSTGHKLTVDQLSNLISLRRETCWTFKSKIETHMKQYKRFKNPNEGWKEMIIVKPKTS